MIDPEVFPWQLMKQNFNPIGRLYYCASVMLCVPCALAQEVALALGSQAGETRLKEVVRSSGFTRFHRAVESPLNIVYEARP